MKGTYILIIIIHSLVSLNIFSVFYFIHHHEIYLYERKPVFILPLMNPQGRIVFKMYDIIFVVYSAVNKWFIR